MAWILLLGKAPRGQVQRHLDTLYRLWAEPAEWELSQAPQTDLPMWGTRGRRPRLAWVSALDRDSKAPYQDPMLFA
eukprot:4922817-Pyramimonas_sp.AAC.1